MKVLSREDILTANDLTKTEVELTELGGSVFVSTLNGKDFGKFQKSVYQRDGKKLITDEENFTVKLLVWTVVNEKGERIFNDKDIEELQKKSAKTIQKLFDVASRLNGLSKDVIDEKKENFS